MPRNSDHLEDPRSKQATSFNSHTAADIPQLVVTDLTTDPPCASDLNQREWHRIEKDLYLHTSPLQSAWLYVQLVNAKDLEAEDLLVMDISVGLTPPPNPSPHHTWESRPCGIWLLRSKHCGNVDDAITEVDVLFGVDAVDPRPQWTLMDSALLLNAQPKIPTARISLRRGRPKPRLNPEIVLRARKDGSFKVVQISDTHMVTGVGVCKDAIDADGNFLPEGEADPLTVNFVETVLDIERPDLVILTGDQLHHDIPDSQSALFKVVAPIIKRSIPFAAVFGNHDSEGVHALSRAAQMSILQSLPFSLCESGPEEITGIGNFYRQILAPTPSQLPLSTLYFLDSHGQVPKSHDYSHIEQNQIDWFVHTSQALRRAHEDNNYEHPVHLSLAFLHIPLPEFGDRHLRIYSGQRREPTEGPRCNSHFYDALAKEGIVAVGCGHDHVNDFCALLSHQKPQDHGKATGPWLCYGGGSGFGGYCSYGKQRFHRRTRVWEMNTLVGSLKTWMRVEYASDRVDELVLVESGTVMDSPRPKDKSRSCLVS